MATTDEIKLDKIDVTYVTYSEKIPEIHSTSSRAALVPRGTSDEQQDEESRPPQLPPGPDDFPEGGTRGWLVAAGTAGIMFCTLGYANSFGVFQAYYIQNQLRDHSPDEISWIGSLQVFLVFAVGVLGGPIFDRYGPWVSHSLLVFFAP
jgi:hypothetical protein